MAATQEVQQNRQTQYPTRMEIDPFACSKNYAWLKKYMLTDEEIEDYFFYNPVADRHVFAYHEHAEDAFYEARDVNGRMPKTIANGPKPTMFLGEASDTVIVVEDLVSAIRIARNYCVLPLFGSFMPNEKMAAVAKRASKCLLWLDCDKYSLGMHYAKDMGMLVPTIAVQTLLDPKALPDDAIIHVVENALETLEGTYVTE